MASAKPTSSSTVWVVAYMLFLIPPSDAFYWGLYPVCAQSQLGVNAPTECDTANAQGVGCLCANSSWLTSSAKLVWQNCGCDVLSQTAQTTLSICQSYGYPIAINPTQFIAAGDGGTSICTNPSNFTGSSSSSTQVATSTSSATGPESIRTSGISGGAIAGIVIGVVLSLALLILAAFALICLRRRRKQQLPATETDPQLAFVDGKPELADTQASSTQSAYAKELPGITAPAKLHELDSKTSAITSELQA